MAFVNFIIYTILFVEIILIIYLRKEVISLINELLGKIKVKPKVEQSDYEKVRSYILKELDKGFTFEQVTDALEKIGWEKGMVDLVMGDIKKRPKL